MMTRTVCSCRRYPTTSKTLLITTGAAATIGCAPNMMVVAVIMLIIHFSIAIVHLLLIFV